MAFSALASGFSARSAEHRADILRIWLCPILKFRSLVFVNAVKPKLNLHVLLETIHMFFFRLPIDAIGACLNSPFVP
jgi:hypothetical protein